MLNITLKDRKHAPTSNQCGHMTRSEDPQLYLIPCVLCMVATGKSHFDVSSFKGAVGDV